MNARKFLTIAGGAVCAAAFLSACGGGGGGAVTPPAGGSPVSGGGTQSVKAERSLTSSALTSVGNAVDFNDLGGVNGTFSVKALRTLQSMSRNAADATPGACNNGVEESQSSNGTGNITETIEFFYDSACTQPYKLITRTISFTGPGDGSVQFTKEVWDQSGNVVAYSTGSATFSTSNGQVTLTEQEQIAPAPSASPFAQTGRTCIYGVPSTPIDCGAGTVTNIDEPTASPSPISESVGFEGTLSGTLSTPTPAPTATPSGQTLQWNGGQLQLTINGNGYIGALNGLTLAPGSPPSWTISGGTQVATLTGNATIGFGGEEDGQQAGDGVTSTLSLTLTDTADGLTATLSASGGKLTGNVTNSSGAVVATISLDFSGSGTITYSDGTTASVRDWIILG